MEQIIKKIAYIALGIFALLFVFAALVGNNKSSKETNVPQQVEQKKETEVRENNPKEEKIKRVKESADRWGRICPYTYYSSAEDDCKNRYIQCFGTPSTDEDYEMYQIWKEIFMTLWKEKQDAKRKMDNM